ncbi:hypothetical protein [Pelagicoccus albus]|uniref:Uncharacterized protein n=1 Tax=Pelagicoccus albus TaxID=415222 RepID=A0A7X1E825_9BACT|nr:hypothetical protein [Pelagicoccus albus]MBC2605811.1 hypothetical protein [Pelagicoccus albus]
MKTSTITLSVLLVGAVAYAGFLQIELNKLKEKSAIGSEDVAASLENQVLDTAGTPASRALGPDGEAGPPPDSPEDGMSREERRRARMEQMLTAFEDPQIRMDMIERQMNRVDERYAAFFKTLDLSPEALETLRTLMAESGVVDWEMRMRGFSAETEEDRDRISMERDLQKDVLADEIAALIGEESAAALAEYTASLPYRNEVDALASSLSFTESPLSSEQSEALVSSIASVSQDYEYTKDLSSIRGREASEITASDISTYFSERAERDAQVLEAAADSLSDEQLAAFAERQLAERERDQRQMEFMVQNPGSGGPGFGGPRGGGPPR